MEEGGTFLTFARSKSETNKREYGLKKSAISRVKLTNDAFFFRVPRLLF